MTSQDPKADLLARVLDDVQAFGLVDRSMRDIATSIGSSHRMLNYHFGSPAGLVTAIVSEVEFQQRQTLRSLTNRAGTSSEVMRAMWLSVSAPEMMGFVRLFFEAVVLAAQRRPGTEGFLESLTDTWLDDGSQLVTTKAIPADRTDLRLGVAVMRGLLLDVIATGNSDAATASFERFVEMWEQTRPT